MKKVISWILTLALLFSLVPADALTLTAEAATVASGKCGTNLTWTLDDEGTLTISGTGAMADYTYNTMPWYSRRASIKTVIIGSGVTSIGKNAFCEHTNLTSVTIGADVKTIDDYAFCYCNKLNSVTIPNRVTCIGVYAFFNCISLSGDMVIPDSVSNIERAAFYQCTDLTSVTIGNSVETIGDSAFQYCTGLTSVTIGNGVKTIGSSAFHGCTGLTSVTIPDSVKSIGSLAFQECTGLTGELTIPDSVTSIGQQAFTNCTGLTSVTLGIRITTIGSVAFAGCTGLTSVTIPDSVTQVGTYAFKGCVGLDEVYFEGSAPSIGVYAFQHVNATAYYNSDETWTEDVRQDYGGDITWVARTKATQGLIFTLSSDGTYYSVTGLEDSCTDTDIVIPSTHQGKPVKAIGNSAFEGNTNITSVKIPDSVTSIGGYAFYVCTGLTGIWVSGDNPNYSSDERGVLFNKNKTELIQAPGSISGNYIIPDSVTIIHSYAFSHCAGLTGELIIPDSVSIISDNAFSWCTSLTSVTLGNGLETIGYYAFNWCASLTGELIIPDSITSIGNYAFHNCIGLTSVTLGNGLETIGYEAFYYCTALKEIYFEGSAPAIGSTAFRNVTATAYYYPDESWTEDVRQNYDGNITWVALSKCEHDFTDWMTIELECVSYNIRVCKKCGYAETDLPDNVIHEHIWRSEDKAPTCTEQGYKDYIWCEGCDLTAYKVTIDALGHDDSGEWQKDETGHWKICQRPECGDKILEADHSHGQWVEDTPAKCETAGTKHRTCECGHIEYDTAPKLGHDDSGVWQYDANGHWKICQRPECGEKIKVENHTHSKSEQTAATCTEQGYTTYTCKCGHSENRDFYGPLDHDHSGSWQYNDTNHWKTCQRSGCSEQLDKASHAFTKVKVDVTCTTDGYTIYSCDCGYTDKRDVVTAPGHDDSGEWYHNEDQHWKICLRPECGDKILTAGHSYGDWVVDTEAKCETAGSKHRTCTKCGYIQRETIPELDHIQNGVWHYDADGHWKICQRPGCGDKILAADHSLRKGAVTAPTCTEQGYTTYHCDCGYSVQKDFTDAKIHDESGEWQYNDTQHWKICQRPECGKTILLENHQHNMLAGSVPATCTEQGYNIYSCKCEHTENRDFNGPLKHIPGSWQYNSTHHWKTCQRENCGAELEKAEHTLKTQKVEVTCTTDGYTTGYCDCGYCTDPYDVETAPGHDDSGEWYHNEDQHWKICLRPECGDKILTAGHSYGDWVVDAEAKCETAGSKHRTCTKCGYVQHKEITKQDHIQNGVWHYDADGHWKICQRPGCGDKILAADHSLRKGAVTAPTCTEQGYTTYHCDCGYSVQKDFTDAKIHDESGEWQYNDTQHWKICQRPECGETILRADHKFTIVKVDATCTKDGYTTYSCGCGYTDKRDVVTIPGHDHSGEWKHDGNGHWKICQRVGCGEKLLAAGHSYGDWVVDAEAKCETAGSKHRTCTTCGYVQREVITAPGHDASGEWKHNNSQHWKVCGECGETIRMSSHSYGNWITDKAAECEKEGAKHRTCLCGYTEYDVIPVKGHDHSGSWQKDASGHWKICSRDNCDKILDKSSHNYGEYVLKTVKSTQNGITVFTHYVVTECEKCGYEWSSDSTDVHIHERVTVIHSVEPTCTEQGCTVGLICAECGEILIATTVIPALGHHFVDGVCDRCGAVYMIGDVNGDGMINSLDGLILMRYLNGWNVKVAVPEAMDVNCDGKVNSLDGLILMRYLNGWNVTLG